MEVDAKEEEVVALNAAIAVDGARRRELDTILVELEAKIAEEEAIETTTRSNNVVVISSLDFHNDEKPQ